MPPSFPSGGVGTKLPHVSTLAALAVLEAEARPGFALSEDDGFTFLLHAEEAFDLVSRTCGGDSGLVLTECFGLFRPPSSDTGLSTGSILRFLPAVDPPLPFAAALVVLTSFTEEPKGSFLGAGMRSLKVDPFVFGVESDAEEGESRSGASAPIPERGPLDAGETP